MKDDIERALQPLLGEPLSDMWRGGFQIFEFGEQRPGVNRKGEPVTFGDYSLHVSCAWRIIGPDGVVVGSDDYRLHAEDPELFPAFDLDTPEPDWRSARVRAFFARWEDAPPRVGAIEVDGAGSVRFALSGGLRLEILPLNSLPDEHWRLLHSDRSKPHFVVTGAGIEG